MTFWFLDRDWNLWLLPWHADHTVYTRDVHDVILQERAEGSAGGTNHSQQQDER